MRRLQSDIPDFVFDAWIAPLQAKIARERLVLGCPTVFHRDRVRRNYLDAITRACKEASDALRDRSEMPSSDARSPGLQIELLTREEFAEVAGHAIEVRTGMQRVRPQAAATALRAVNGPEAGGVRTAGPFNTSDASDTSDTPDAPSLFSQPSPGAPASPSRISGPSISTTSISFDGSPRTMGNGPSEGSRSGAGMGFERTWQESGARGGARAKRASGGPLLRLSDPPLERGEPSFGLKGEPRKRNEDPFRFESFIAGPCNALAREATMALARRRQQSLNAIYLAGRSGMGKTHLARAAAHEAQMNLQPRTAPASRPGSPAAGPDGMHRARIIYTTAEQFTSEFVSAMRNGRNEAWTRRYRGPIELLVVEDIQFLDGRTKTQLELFHTVAHVLESGGRILLTGDRAPRDLIGLDDRLRSVVSRSFIAELDRPDPIVRRHILREKASAGGFALPEDCLDLLVEATSAETKPGGGASSVTDLESLLIQVVTTASLSGRAVDLDLVREAIDLKTGAGADLAPRQTSVSEIVCAVATFFGKRPEALAARSRRRDVLVPRQLAMYMAHRYTDASLTEIGRSLGRDHPAVRNAIKRIERQLLENAPLRYQVEALSEKIDALLEGDPGPQASSR